VIIDPARLRADARRNLVCQMRLHSVPRQVHERISHSVEEVIAAVEGTARIQTRQKKLSNAFLALVNQKIRALEGTQVAPLPRKRLLYGGNQDLTEKASMCLFSSQAVAVSLAGNFRHQ
jgi:hypothetical protein